ncbi:fructose-specific PTS transporter subunit EIIC [Spiroplasma sp. BIUS-1]|uniref:PTS fructose transporter subunit IIABC n=1 Tax=Spiroplasma sp. BIUS-1 TaxID=216964 RepID=UPI001397C8BF|nr:fructose-specific PTS transporter subunit EIIC [Spiroplasma sp. BIUS-1]QHX36617.1 PTS system, fructose-specific IIABC component [Spiroplasma sp. BIUS-1]
MELKDLFAKQISFFDVDLNSKDEVIEFLSNKLQAEKYVKSVEDFKAAVYKRESEGSTGVGDGIAIPHVLNPTVQKSAIAFAKLKNKVDWQSLDDQPADLVFMIMTNGKDGNEHLTALADLSGFLMKADVQSKLRSAKSIKDVQSALTKEEKKVEKVEKPGSYDVIGITACPTGIAHTYMAQEKLEEYAKAKGLTVKIETQGRRGIENKLTQEDIDNAKVIILAHDKALEGLSRLNGKKVIDTNTKEAIFKGDQLIEKYKKGEGLTEVKAAGDSSDTSEFTMRKFLDVKGNLLGGISRMLPFVVAGGIILGIAFLIDFASGNGQVDWNSPFAINWLHSQEGNPTEWSQALKDQFTPIWMGNFGTHNPGAGWFAAIGKTSMAMMVPMLGAFIAFSIVGTQGLMPGMVAGLFSSNIMGFAYSSDETGWNGLWGRLLSDNLKGSESGFIGAIFGGYLAALLVVGWSKAMAKFPKGLQGARDIVFIPVISLLSISLTMFVINIPLGYVMGGISLGIQKLAELNLLWLVSILIGFMMCVDMGGPINKIAYSLGNLAVGGKLVTDLNTQGYNDQTIIMASAMLAGMLPPLMVAMSTVIFPKAWTAKDRDAAKANWLMGACFVSEGAIPFMVKDPKRVAVSAMVGGALVGGLVGALKIKLLASHGGIFVFPLLSSSYLENGTSMTGGSIALGAGGALIIVLGASFLSAMILGIWRTADIRTGKLTLDSTNGVKEAIEAKIQAVKANDKIKDKDKKLTVLSTKLTQYGEFESDLVVRQKAYQVKLAEMAKEKEIRQKAKEARKAK